VALSGAAGGYPATVRTRGSRLDTATHCLEQWRPLLLYLGDRDCHHDVQHRSFPIQLPAFGTAAAITLQRNQAQDHQNEHQSGMHSGMLPHYTLANRMQFLSAQDLARRVEVEARQSSNVPGKANGEADARY
jgi:hypothetical protein